jgi:hypothetical protein
MLRGTGVVIARVEGKTMHIAALRSSPMVTDRQDSDGPWDPAHTEACTIERTRCGSYNRVFFLREYPDVVVRVSQRRLDEDEQREYREEIETQRALARHGISPRVFCEVIVEDSVRTASKAKKGLTALTARQGLTALTALKAPKAPKQKVHKVRLGYAMERFDATLADAIKRGYKFTHESKEMLIGLFERAAQIARCVDTTAANVVVAWAPRYPRSSMPDGPYGPYGPVGPDRPDRPDRTIKVKEKKNKSKSKNKNKNNDAMYIAEFRFIDMDGHFCGRVPSRPGTVSGALRAWSECPDASRSCRCGANGAECHNGTGGAGGAYGAKGPTGPNGANGARCHNCNYDERVGAGSYAALGLLVLCVHARLAWLARLLLKYEVGLVRLLSDDAHGSARANGTGPRGPGGPGGPYGPYGPSGPGGNAQGSHALVWTHARVSAMYMLREYAGVRAPWDVPRKLRAIAG